MIDISVKWLKICDGYVGNNHKDFPADQSYMDWLANRIQNESASIIVSHWVVFVNICFRLVVQLWTSTSEQKCWSQLWKQINKPLWSGHPILPQQLQWYNDYYYEGYNNNLLVLVRKKIKKTQIIKQMKTSATRFCAKILYFKNNKTNTQQLTMRKTKLLLC